MKAKLRSLTTAVVFGLLFSLPNLSFAQDELIGTPLQGIPIGNPPLLP